jgi:hypothetical protein
MAIAHFDSLTCILVLVWSFPPGLGATPSRTLRYDNNVCIKEFVRHLTNGPFNNPAFYWRRTYVCRKFMQRLYMALHGTMDAWGPIFVMLLRRVVVHAVLPRRLRPAFLSALFYYISVISTPFLVINVVLQ